MPYSHILLDRLFDDDDEGLAQRLNELQPSATRRKYLDEEWKLSNNDARDFLPIM